MRYNPWLIAIFILAAYLLAGTLDYQATQVLP